MTRIEKKTACTRDCPDACGIIATIENGRVVRLQGDPNHPITQGFLCHRTSRFLERQYSPNRLTQPLLRKQKSGTFEPISIRSALDLTAEKMRQFRDGSGAASILQYRCGGSMGIMKNVGDYFFEKFGPCTIKSGDVCAGAGEAAQLTDFGEFDSSDFYDIHHSKTIFLWGKNVFVSSVHLIPQLKKARKNGAKIVLIDPVHHRTVSIADQFVQPRPGTDAAIAMGIAHWLFDNDRADADAADYCDNLDRFQNMAFSKSIDEWATIADIPTSILIALAESYSQGPTSSLIGWGIQRRRFGATTIRTIDALAAISGNLGIAGGGASFYFMRRGAFDFSFSNPDAVPRSFPEPLLGTRILEAVDPPIRMVYVWGANPVAMLPDSKTVAAAMSSREFCVVVDPFLTDTARCADLVIPTTTMLEESDILGAYGHHYLSEVRPVVDAPEDVLSDHGIFCELAARLDVEFGKDEQFWIDRLLKRVIDTGISREDIGCGYVQNPFANKILFADRKFKTESGKVNLVDELPPELMSTSSADGPRLMALSTDQAQASQWSDDQQAGEITITVHPDATMNLEDGDSVTLQTDVGSIEAKLRFDKEQRADVALADKGGWYFSGRSANALINAEVTDDGECAVYYDTPVTILKSESHGIAESTGEAKQATS